MSKMDRTGASLRYVCGFFLLVVAGIHLYWGIPRFTAYASVGRMPDPRPLAFVLSGHTIVLGMTLVLLGMLDRSRTYLPGIALMIVHLGGYVAWHTVLSHGGSGTAEPSTHNHSSVAHIGVDLVEHLLNSPLALVSKLSELTVLLLLCGLYLIERRGWERRNS